MCEFCAEHGEGKVWYLAMQNYNQELLSQNGRREQIRRFFQDFEASAARSLSALDRIQRLPFIPNAVGAAASSRQKASHFGQVVPLEDVDRLLDQVGSFVRLPCVCRSFTTGRYDRRFCYGLGIDPGAIIGDFPDFGGQLETLSREEARQAIHKLDKDGLVHSVWTFGTPFIGGLCNCDQDCVAYRLQVGAGVMQVYFPAEYVAAVDLDLCRGCMQCRARCPFGAVRYSASLDKCLVDPNLCYGCGVCRAACSRGAIRLEPRLRPWRWERRRQQPGARRVTAAACSDPRQCRRCLEVCPAQVFAIAPRQPRASGREAQEWQIHAVFQSRCTNCGACMQACPEGAIRLQPG